MLKILFGLLIVIVLVCIWFWPSPSPFARNRVKKLDYETMEYVFDQSPLPPSMKISQVQYRGYSLIFNGPDGPAYSNYELTIDSTDWTALRQKLLAFREPKVQSRMWHPVWTFDSDLSDYYHSFESPEESDAQVQGYTVVRPMADNEYKTWSTVLVDDRSSTTIKLYVSSRAYLRQK